MFTRNYHAMKSHSLFGESPRIVTRGGEDYSSTNTLPSITGLLGTIQTGTSAGVILGTGNKAPTLYDYDLSGDQVTGFTYSRTVTSGEGPTGPWAKAKYTITNNNKQPIKIAEIGLLAGNTVCLIERTVLEMPITIEASGGVGQIEYTINYDVPTMVPETNLDQPGVYGVEWDFSKGDTTLKRFANAKELEAPKPAEGLEATGSSPFDAIAPWSGMKRYNITDGVIGPSEDDEGFDPVNADTVVHIPEFYMAAQSLPYEQKMRWAISPEPRPGFVKHPGSGRYIGRYHTSTVSGTYSSKSGHKPQVNMTRATARTKSHSKGAKWFQLDYATWCAVQLLYLVEFADWNSQKILGTGQTTGSLQACGGTDTAVYHTVKASKASNTYRWIEDPWSNCYDFLDGFINNRGYAYINLDNTKNADVRDDFTPTGKSIGDGSITRYHYSDEFPWAFIPMRGGGSDSTYVTDTSSRGTSENLIAYAGGYYSESAGAGLFFLNSGSDATLNRSILGSRLLFVP